MSLFKRKYAGSVPTVSTFELKPVTDEEYADVVQTAAAEDEEAPIALVPQAALPPPKKRAVKKNGAAKPVAISLEDIPDGELAIDVPAKAGVKRATPHVSTLTPAVPPPHFEFDSKTLGSRELPATRGTIRVVLENAKMIGDALSAIAGLASMFPMSISPDGITIRLLDTSNALYFKLEIPKDSFLVYENVRASDTTVIVSSAAFQTRRQQFSADCTLTFAFQNVPAEATDLIVQIFPRTGKASDGIVTRFNIPTSDSSYEVLDHIDDADFYHYEFTFTHAMLLKLIGYFKASMGSVAITVTEQSIDFAGQCDDNTKQTVQVPFLDAASKTHAEIDDLVRANPQKCFRNVVKPSTAARPANIVNFRFSLMYMRRSLVTLAGCRCVRLSVGRSYEKRNGDLTPMRFQGSYESAVSGKTIEVMTVYLAPEIESEN